MRMFVLLICPLLKSCSCRVWNPLSEGYGCFLLEENLCWLRFCHSSGKVWEMPLTCTAVLSTGVLFLHRGKSMPILAWKEKTLLIFVSNSEICCNENKGYAFQRIKTISSMLQKWSILHQQITRWGTILHCSRILSIAANADLCII